MDIVELIKNPLFNHSALAELLYGSRESKNRAKVSKKVNGIHQWQEWELKRLEEIFQELKKSL